jgi:hypothetical protein
VESAVNEEADPAFKDHRKHFERHGIVEKCDELRKILDANGH